MTTTSAPGTAHSLPAFNINGTNPRAIEDEYEAALKAVRIAEQLLVAATCHGRDFQTLPPTAFEQARDQRMQMLKHLCEVHDYIEAWYWHAVDAQ
ncbi:hypothetical protein SynBIOSE41_00813 [Synechococcus sp. BIOS-E4-1]|uniref:hypothetical protein n=1 Tax=Synechococcus sp. BIOS-E4-1 TaxID=1400864 RepID=UPI001645257D|nr:hypothetical protein [Synechococcus sp. BIOS-E4-1]QNI53345.1 hypothetical protein SynBIOSE41_00813 [Synechococcus sp. BIOS-E4-1]